MTAATTVNALRAEQRRWLGRGGRRGPSGWGLSHMNLKPGSKVVPSINAD